MKDFVRENWKIAAMFAAGAFILSLLTGSIARNPAGVVFLRAFLFALLFGGLGIGLRFVIRTYLPEMAANGAADTGEQKDDVRGSKLNIVVGEENESPVPRARSARARPTASPEASEPTEEPGEDDLEQDAQAEARALGDLADELAEELPGASESDGSEDRPDEEGAEQGEGYQEEAEASESGGDVGGLGTPSSEGDLDSLPDISTLEMAEDPSPRGAAGRMGRGPGGEQTPEDAMRGALSGQDPLTLARAIRTVLKKDEKG